MSTIAWGRRAYDVVVAIRHPQRFHLVQKLLQFLSIQSVCLKRFDNYSLPLACHYSVKTGGYLHRLVHRGRAEDGLGAHGETGRISTGMR